MNIKILARSFFDYSKYMRGYSDNTIRRYKQVINFYSNSYEVENIEDVSMENLRKLFFDGRTSRNWSSNTFINYHKTLSVFFQWCVKEGFMTEDLTKDIEVPKLEKRLPPKLNKQQALRLLEVVYNYPYFYKFLRYRNHAIFATFVYTGLRKHELLNLKLADVDLENFCIFVRQGKGAKDRMVPVSFRLADILKEYLKERKRLKKTCPEFFTSLNRDTGFTNTGLKRLVEKVKKASGIYFTIHKLRHTFATLMLEGGCDIYSLSRMMGHADIKTTTIYLAASAEHLRGEIMKHPLNNL